MHRGSLMRAEWALLGRDILQPPDLMGSLEELEGTSEEQPTTSSWYSEYCGQMCGFVVSLQCLK